ncbi:MAG: DNA cytosine methyltransferase [Gemmatimonadetes bacterium]|nr:DNA cytosine methyltransferase [Gemmatimonadota bacterium]
MTVQVYDFFAGCGGASCGFRAAGMGISFALDHDANARKSFKANFPDVHFEPEDIRDVSVELVRQRVDSERPSPVLFSGCAPCQPFSKQKTKRPSLDEDERVPLLAHFARFVEGCKPDLVFVENVPGLQKLDSESQPFGDFLKRLDAAEYEIDCRPIRLSKYGIPQTRRRLLLIASLHGVIRIPDETHGPGTSNVRYTTVRDWISHLPAIHAGEEHNGVLNHKAAKLSERNLDRIKATPEGGGERDWPEYLKLECHKGFTGYSDVYGRMAWDSPASGLTTRCISYSNGRFGHPEQDRAISIREAACLQTFPEDFMFNGSMASMARQIGNAVPVHLAKLIGKHFIEHLKDVGRLS